MMKTKSLTILFFTVSILDIVGVAFNNSLLQIIFKPLIIPSLIALYYFSIDKKNNWYVVALIFSFLGDVLLMDKNNLFLFGIAAFLITQLLYIKIIASQLKKSNFIQKSIALTPFVIFFFVLITVLKDNLNQFLVPVIIYGIAISVFGVIALLNYQINKTKTAQLLIIGAVIFIASDSIIALHKFHEPKSFYPVAIMITYVLAQYLIYKFMIKVSLKN